jgi:polysaccharide export outer membrane protein
LALAFLSACAGPRPVGLDPAIQLADLSSLPAPSASDYVAGVDQSERVRPLDTLKIEVFEVPELEREIQIGSDGTLRFPLIDSFGVNDLSPSQVAVEIENRLRGRFVIEPSVSVSFAARGGQTFTIGGQVNRPGQYTLPARTSLLEAVAIGGGLGEYAKHDDVLVLRDINGERYIGIYNIRAIQRGNYSDPPLYANDIVMVGDSPNRRLLESILGVLPAVTSSIVLIDRVSR